MLHNVLVKARVLTGNVVQVKFFTVPVHDADELDTFIKDLDYRFDCVLEVGASPLLSSLN